MTTLAYKNGDIAYDSYTTGNDDTILITNSDKKIIDADNKFVCVHSGHIESRDECLEIYRHHKDIWNRNFSFQRKVNSNKIINDKFYPCAFIVVNYGAVKNIPIISLLDFRIMNFDEEAVLFYTNMIIDYNQILSIGSGSQFAYGAMDFGATAKEAVAIAAIRDPHTGGDINSFNLKHFNF